MSVPLFFLEPGGTPNFFAPVGFHPLNPFASNQNFGFLDGIEVLDGVTGLDLPPIRADRTKVAGLPGTLLQQVEFDTRTIDVPVIFAAAPGEQLDDTIRRWRQILNPKRGWAQLWAITGNGARYATCRYSQGLETADRSSDGTALAVLTFDADDPHFYAVTPVSLSAALGGTIPVWFDAGVPKAILPVQLATSSLRGDLVVAVEGDADTWPTWTFEGPGSDLTVENTTTGRSFVWSSDLIAGDRLTVDTRPGVKSVLLNGTPAFDALTAWDLWPLTPGTNQVNISVTSATSASRVTIEWQPAYLGF